MKIKYKQVAAFLLGGIFFAFTSCEEGLDYKNENSIVPDAVWQDPAMIDGFLNDIYGGLNPGWIFNASSSDEGLNSAKDLNNYLRGIITVDNSSYSLDYKYVDKINFFLSNLVNVSTDILSKEDNDLFMAQAKFWRAWTYWTMVKQVGGVPLILEPQDASQLESLYKERNKTSECLAQIIQDLDDAIAVLPGKYTDETNDYGRITKGAAMAFKGRVLLWYASPLFNPDNNKERWETAYKANKEAVDFLTQEGFGLYPDFRNLWYDERNEEVIMVNQYFYPGHSINFNAIRPEPFTKDGSWQNQPLMSLLLAFPKKDGSTMTLDKERLKNDSQYNQDFMTDFYMNRDDRFYTSVYCGGTQYPTPDLLPGSSEKQTLWLAWRWDTNSNKYNTLYTDFSIVGSPGITGFCDRKGLDTTLINSEVGNGQTDWIEIRYAEVLMNMGECANEVGEPEKALQVLYDIRKRAGINAGSDGRYGIKASSVEDIRSAYINERFVEFAYEGKRFDDLRRWKRFDILNSQKTRHALYLVLKAGAPLPSLSETIMDAETRRSFQFEYVDNLDGDNAYVFNLSLNHWFYPLNPNQISQSLNKLEQNKEWGGTFDPLQ